MYLIVFNQKSELFSDSLQIQLSAIYKPNGIIQVKIPEIQQQDNCYDCGIFAIAHLVEFCFNSNYSGTKFITFCNKYFRDHLITCLENQCFQPFPKESKKTKLKKVKTKTVKIECNCRCGKPDCLEDMVGCDWIDGKCNIWYHKQFVCTKL